MNLSDFPPLPTRIRVAYADYAIQHWTPTEARAAGRLGECDSLMKAIRIDFDSRDARSTAETLIHEVLHAAYYTFGIEDDDKEERTVNLLGGALATIWRDNPELIAWLEGVLR